MIAWSKIVIPCLLRAALAALLVSFAFAAAAQTRQASLSTLQGGSGLPGGLFNAQAPVLKAPQQFDQRAAQQATPTPVAQRTSSKIQIVAGQGDVIPVDRPVSDVLVGDPNVADVRPLSPTMLYVFGNKLGRT